MILDLFSDFAYGLLPEMGVVSEMRRGPGVSQLTKRFVTGWNAE